MSNGYNDARREPGAGMIMVGGIALVLTAIAFIGVFTYLAGAFNYPDVLDGAAADVLPALLATGSTGRAAWAFYAVLPLFWIPAAIGASEALRTRDAALMRMAEFFAFLAAIAMTLGLMRWPSVHWQLAEAWTGAGEEQRTVLAAMFDGLNVYLGNYIGEFLGEFGFSMFFLLSGIAILRSGRFPVWLAWWGIATAVLGLIGLWRNVTDAVDFIGEINNYLLPLWMVGFGAALLIDARRRSRATTAGDRIRTAAAR